MTRDSYAKTLARLTTLAGDRPAAMLMPEDYAAVMARWDGAVAPQGRCSSPGPGR